MSKATKTHFKEHIGEMSFPTKGSEILAMCNNMMDIPAEEKKKVDQGIDPDKTYNSLDDVMMDVKLEESEEMGEENM